MYMPEQQQIDHWIQTASQRIKRKHELLQEDFYHQENIPLQCHYTGLADWHATLARAKFLSGAPIEAVRGQFAQAATYMVKNFAMAYDPSDPDYQADASDWSSVSETAAIEGMHCGMISCNFNLASRLASLFRNRGDGYAMSIEVNRYAHALAHALKREEGEARRILDEQMAVYLKATANRGCRWNYHTLGLALEGILEMDEEKFNQGLLSQVEFYAGYAQGEARGTSCEYICDNAVALANLGIRYGLKVTVQHDVIPEGLLIHRL